MPSVLPKELEAVFDAKDHGAVPTMFHWLPPLPNVLNMPWSSPYGSAHSCMAFHHASANASDAVFFGAPITRFLQYTGANRCFNESRSVLRATTVVAVEAILDWYPAGPDALGRARDPLCPRVYANLSRSVLPLNEQSIGSRWPGNPIIAVPYVSWMHAPSDAALESALAYLHTAPRTRIAAIYAPPHHRHDGYMKRMDTVRIRAASACQRFPDESCLVLSSTKPPAGVTFHEWVVQIYASTDFCMMPQGDTPFRAAIFDAIAALCIPVFFSSCLSSELAFERMYEPFLPPHERTQWGVGEWAVLLHETEVGRLEAALRNISADRVRALRSRLRELAPRVQYAAGTGTSVSAGRIYEQLIQRISRPSVDQVI